MTAGVWAMGLFVLTVLVRVALPIELGQVRSPLLAEAEPSAVRPALASRAARGRLEPAESRRRTR